MIVFQEMLGPGDVYVCATCACHLSLVDLEESRQFTGKTGPAYLMTQVWNHTCGPEEKRHLLTGEHTIREMYCSQCESNVGWTYVHTFEEAQQYKVGKFILERARIRKVRDKASTKPRGRKSKRAAAKTQDE